MAELAKLTHTRLLTLRKCPKQHQLRYELGLVPTRDAGAPRRMGSAFHTGQEAHNRGADDAGVMEAALAGYETCPTYADAQDWGVERETVRTLLAGHLWRYSADNVEVIAVELPFDIPLINPDTGAASRTFTLAGKIDAIIRLSDGRLAVLEYKTAGEDITPDSEYWLRLRCDSQISQYVIAARAIGYDIACVMYDVTRKPTIKPLAVPLLDEQGLKIVLDAAGNRVVKKDGTPRQSASTADGYILQTRTESPEEFGARLLNDIGDRPDYYYQRREVPRLEDELTAYQLEVWQQAQQLMAAQRCGRWFRNVGRWSCGYCDYANLCLNNISVQPGTAPGGYEFVSDVNPELQNQGENL